MKPFRLAGLLALVASVILLVVNLSWVAADSSDTDTADAQYLVLDLPTDTASSIEVQSYTREYGVSPTEAMWRFRLLEGVRELNYELDTNEGGIFGGLWVQHIPEFKIVINVTANGKQAIQRYIESGSLEGIAEIQEVKLTLNDLEMLAASTREDLSKAGIPFEYDINIRENRMEIYVGNSVLKSSQAHLEEIEVNSDSNIVIVPTEQQSRKTYSVRGGYKLTRTNGTLECTSGFTVIHSSSGRKGITTAGHCANSLKNDGKRNLVFQDQAYRVVTPPEPYDVQWHTSSVSTDRFLAYIRIGSGSRAIYGQSPRAYQYVGEYICKYGITTGSACGTIVGVNFNGTYIRVHSDVADLSEPGDSGGPWYKDYTAYGLMTGDIEPGNDAYYMAIDYISILGLQLLTY